MLHPVVVWRERIRADMRGRIREWFSSGHAWPTIPIGSGYSDPSIKLDAFCTSFSLACSLNNGRKENSRSECGSTGKTQDEAAVEAKVCWCPSGLLPYSAGYFRMMQIFSKI